MALCIGSMLAFPVSPPHPQATGDLCAVFYPSITIHLPMPCSFFFFLDKSMFFDSPPLFTSNIFSTFSHSPAQMPCVKFLSRALPQLIFCTKRFVNISLLFIVLLPGLWIFAWHQCNLLVCTGDRVLS